MNNLIISILVVVSFWSTTTARLFSQSWEWEKQAEGLATRWQAIDAVDSNVAVAIAWTKISDGKQGIFRTLDGGHSWQEIPWIKERLGGIVDITVTDSLNFWVLTPFAIDHTPDAGRTWELQYSDNSTTSWFNYIEMFDSLNGIAMGDGLPKHPVLILKTFDGGKTWISQNQSHFFNAFSSDIWRCVQFVTPEIGYGRFSNFGVNDSTLYLQKTVDGGQTWQSLPLSHKNFLTIRFYNQEIGLAAWKASQKIFRTLDGGETWNSFATNFDGGWPEDIEFFPNDPSKVLIAFGSYLDCHSGFIQGNLLIFSSDTGKTWSKISTPDIDIFRDIKMVDDKHGWIVGEEGIIHTSPGGATFISDDELIPEEFVLYQNYPNPFNSATVIRFYLKYQDVISLKVYNLMGEEVKTLLANQPCQEGHHSIKFDSEEIVSGIYFYRFTSSRSMQTKLMLLLR